MIEEVNFKPSPLGMGFKAVHKHCFWYVHELTFIVDVQGDSKFVYDVDTVHDLSVTFRVRGFVTSNATVMQAAQSIAESSRRTDREGRIKAFETVNFFPEIMSGELLILQTAYLIFFCGSLVVNHEFV